MKTKSDGKLNFLHLIAISAIGVLYFIKYYHKMILADSVYRAAEWHSLLANSSLIGKSGLLDPLKFGAYQKTLSISLGHQSMMQMHRFFGHDAGSTILYILLALTFIAAIYFLAFVNTKSVSASFLIAMLLANTDFLAMSHVGGVGHIAQSSFARDYVALSFTVLSYYCLSKSRYYLFTLFIIVGFLFHMSDGLFAFVILLPVAWQTIQSKKYVTLHVALFSTLVLGIFIYLSQFVLNAPGSDSALWFKYAYIFNGGHIFFAHSINYYITTYAFFSLLLAGILYALHERKLRFPLLSIMCVWAIIAIFSFLFIYIIPLKIAYSLTPLRSSLLVCFLVQAFILMFLLDDLFTSQRIASRILAGLALISFASGTFIGVFAFCIVTSLSIAIKGNVKIRIAGLVFSLIIAGLMFVTLKQGTGMIAPKNLAPVAAGGLIILVYSIFNQTAFITRHQRFIRIIFFFVISGICFLVPSVYVTQIPPETIQTIDEYNHIGTLIQNEVPVGEPVLSAPLIGMPMLEIVANRGSIFQLSKAHIAFMVPAVLPDFDEALKDLHIDIANYQGNWIDICRDAPTIWRETISKDYAIKLKNKYQASHMLTYADHILDFETVYRGKHFILYKIGDINSCEN